MNKSTTAGRLPPSCETLESRLLLASDLTHGVAHLSQARTLAQVAAVGENVYFIGGVRNTKRDYASTAVDVYNTHRHRWYAATLPSDFFIGKVYTVGHDLVSVGATKVDVYDTASQALTDHALSHFAPVAVVAGEKLLLVGTYTESVTYIFPTQAVDVFDASTGQWTTSDHQAEAPYPATATVDRQALLISEEVYSFHGGFFYSDSLDVFDADSNAWTTLTLPTDVSNAAIATLPHQVVIAGGAAGAGNTTFYTQGFNATADVAVYHADTRTLTTTTLSQARSNIAEATVGDVAVFAGGSYFKHYGKQYAQRAVDLYNATTGQWNTASLSTPRGDPKSAVAGGVALFYGGSTDTRTIDVYTAATGVFSTTQLPDALSDPKTVTVGHDVLFYSDTSATIDVYDSTTGTWSRQSLTAARTGMAVTVAGNQAIFAGGVNARGVSGVIDTFSAT